MTDTPSAPAPAAGRPRLTIALLAVIATCVAIVAVAAGYLWGASGDSPASTPSTTSVDAGFARDMSTHHTQAVTMANYERDNTTDPALKLLAYDIETGQQFQIGQMSGWLDAWGLSRSTDEPQMAWMTADHGMQIGADGLMPGMASPAEMNKLQSSHGRALDVLFLQLMIRHHQGGVDMAQYAVDHATVDYVRTTAGAMAAAQSSEIVSMEQLLRKLGGTLLPAP